MKIKLDGIKLEMVENGKKYTKVTNFYREILINFQLAKYYDFFIFINLKKL